MLDTAGSDMHMDREAEEESSQEELRNQDNG